MLPRVIFVSLIQLIFATGSVLSVSIPPAPAASLNIRRPINQSKNISEPKGPDWLFRDCPVPGSKINVKFAPTGQRVSAPRMHDMFVQVILFAHSRLVESGRTVDRPLRPDELPFEFEGTGASRWYYVDLEQSPIEVLTWDKISRAFEGLLMCAFHRQLYFGIHFEIWEWTGIGGEYHEWRLGHGDFGMLQPALLQAKGRNVSES
ncbi:MAG: hypothetical protein Q9222_004501 [Ikaeria aurantiellina]